jgi:MSHA biogenesis protein MshL
MKRLPLAVAGAWLLAACAAPRQNQAAAPEPADAAALPSYQPMLLLPMPDLRAARAAAVPLAAMSGRDTPIGDLLLALFKDSDVNLLVDPGVEGSLTFDIKNSTVEEALEALLRSIDLAYEWDGGFLRVRERVRQTFDVDVPSREAQAAGSAAQSSSSSSSSAGDGGSLWDTLSADLATLAGDGQVILNRTAGTIAVEARPSVVERIRRYLDHAVRRASNQVSLEARILEVRLSDEFRLGVNWALLPGFFNSDETGTLPGGGMIGQTAASGAAAFNVGVLKTGDFSVFVDALENQGQVRVLSSPRVSTLNNSPATIRVVDQIPVIDREVIDSQGGLRTQFDIRFVEAGVSVNVTPQIGADGVVTVQVNPRVTERTGTVVTPDGLQEEPILSTRETTTTVRVADGQAVVIGGLRSTRKGENLAGVPVLSSIPLLGSLFRSTVQTREEVELMVLVVPRVLDSSWIDEDLRRGAHRLFALRRPFGLGTLALDAQRPEDWQTGALQGMPQHPSGPDLRHVPAAPPAAPGAAAGATITRKGLAARLVQRAQTALAAGDDTQALAELEHALALDPGHAEALIAAAMLHGRRAGGGGRARELAERCIAQGADQPLALAAIGTLEALAGAPRAAQRWLEAAHAKLGAPWTACNLGAALLLLGENAQARDVLRAHARPDSPPELLANLAFAELAAGDVAAARQSAQAALAAGASPRNPRVSALLVRIERAERQPGAAR